MKNACIFLSFTFMVLLFSQCEQNKDQAKAQTLAERIALLEARQGAIPSTENLKALVEAYEQQSKDSTLSPTLRLDRIRYVAEANYVMRNSNLAYQTLRQGIADFNNANSVINASLFLAELAIQTRNEQQTANSIFACLRKEYPGHPDLKKIPEEYRHLSNFDSLQLAMQQDIYRKSFDKEKAVTYGNASFAYTAIMKNDSLVIKDHLAAGRVLEQAKQYKLAFQHYDELMRRYPDHPRTGDAMFLKAVILDQVYSNKKAAQSLVTNFIDKFPEHKLAADAKAFKESTILN